MKTVIAALFMLSSLHASWCQNQNNDALARILSNEKLWGKDVRTALIDASAYHKIGKKSVVIFDARVVPSDGSKDSTLNADLANFHKTLNESSPRILARINAYLACDSRPGSVACRTPSNPSNQHITVINDQGKKILATAPSTVQFIAPTATIDTVQQQLGVPERISHETLQTKYERRPVVLTKYTYASGDITFATSNLAPNGKIDRVVINTDALAALKPAAR